MRGRLGWGAILCLLCARPASAQRIGDPTPGSQAPLVVLVTPMDGGIVGARWRVQARVQHPSGLSAVASVSLQVTGATTSTTALVRNARYDAGQIGVYEAVVAFAPGSWTLVATVTDVVGRSTSSSAVTVVANANQGDGNLLVRDGSSQLCTACHALSDHGSETVGRANGAWTTTCRDCHAPHGTRNVHLVKEAIRPPWVTGGTAPAASPVRFSNRSGFAPGGGTANRAQASFANGDGSGPCQVCHTRTVRWRSDAAADAIHLGDCAFCHRHTTGFGARCQDCHPAPPSTGAHAAHHGASAPTPPFPSDPRPLGCGNCHPTDPTRHGDGVQQVELNQGLVLPGGTRLAGAQLSGPAASPSCLVACHFPLGAPTPAQPVAWSTTGPLPCTSCHTKINPGGGTPAPPQGPSLHDPIFSEARPPSGEPTTCFTCHDSARHDASHLTGDPALVVSTTVDTTCVACHTPPSGPAAGPPGQVLHAGADPATSWTPPVFPGWSASVVDGTSGDFHGGRRGTCFDPNLGPATCAPGVTPTGFGGSLKPPYYRGYPAMSCVTCHAGHASENAFLFAPSVNGATIPARAIDRQGVGAERLCEACHDGGRHDRCVECHGVDPEPPGTPCFYCHGHEGIRFWINPYPGLNMTSWSNPACNHCHSSGWMPAARTSPPSSGGPSVTGITSGGATVSWSTDEGATTWIEYGVGMPGYVAGNDAFTASHTITLSGLAAGTTYVYRVRSVDPMRNVLRTSLTTFTTIAAGGVPFPDAIATGWLSFGSSPATGTLEWFGVTTPTGNAVEYRVQLASDPAFTGLSNGSPPDSGWITGNVRTWNGREIRSFQVNLTNLPVDDCSLPTPLTNQYYWRVKARDSVTKVESDWSVVVPFEANVYDPWGC